MSMTYTQANRTLDYLFGNTTFTNPATLYVGLSTSTIAANGTGATEPVGNSYARVSVTNNTTNFGSASNGSKSNLTAINFPESSGDWGTITYVFFADQASGGNILYFEALATARAVPTGTTITFAVGAVQISMTNS